MITQWYGWVPYYYRLNIITKAGKILDMQLLSNKIYLYPEQILRAWYKHERKYASRGKSGIRRNRCENCHSENHNILRVKSHLTKGFVQ